MPPTCSICFEPFTSPVSLPCGHVFCQECIRRTVDAVKSCSPQHFCPTCRRPYSIITIDPALVPPYLRPHIHPSVRQVFIDASTSSPVDSTSAGPSSPATPASSSPSASTSSSTSASTSAPSPPASDAALARAHAELEALKASCATWRRRAEIHAAANGSLLSFARAARDCALRLRSERDAARSRCTLLKRTLSETLPQSTLGPLSLSLSPASDAADAAADTAHARSEVARGVGGACGLPVYLMQMQGRPGAHYYDNPRDMEESHFGPPLKRRKVADTDSDSSATPSSSPSSSVSAASPPRAGDAPAPAPKPTPARTQASPPRTRNRHRPQPRVIATASITPVSDAPLSVSGPNPSPAVPVGPFLGSLF